MRGERSEGRHFRLRVVEGPLQGATYRLGDSFVLGRSGACDLALLDPGISRMHARVTRGHTGEHVICDLGSENGTWVNREPIRERTLAVGDEISLCRVRFLFEHIPTDADAARDGRASGRALPEQGTLLPEHEYEGDVLASSGSTQRLSVLQRAPTVRMASVDALERELEAPSTDECGKNRFETATDDAQYQR